MSNNAKELRKQLRNVVQELLPEILLKEMTTAAYKQISGELMAKLSVIDGDIKRALKEIDDRSKNLQTFLIKETLSRISASPVPPPPPSSSVTSADNSTTVNPEEGTKND